MFWRKKKTNQENKCSECGETHEEWPALAFGSPSNYHGLSPEDKETIARLSTDFCEIHYEDQIDRFIRAVLIQPVNDCNQDLEYGLWVSLSEKSYTDYSENFDNQNHETTYFGWLCNYIPDYENTLVIPCNVVTQKGDKRPRIYPHEDFDHQFVKDFYQGISKQEAERRIHNMMKNIDK